MTIVCDNRSDNSCPMQLFICLFFPSSPWCMLGPACDLLRSWTTLACTGYAFFIQERLSKHRLSEDKRDYEGTRCKMWTSFGSTCRNSGLSILAMMLFSMPHDLSYWGGGTSSSFEYKNWWMMKHFDLIFITCKDFKILFIYFTTFNNGRCREAASHK